MSNRLRFLVLVIVTLIIFYPLLFIFFVQDDFFLLSISKVNTVKNFLEFFIPRGDVVWYRPLSSQVFFFLNQKLFGLWSFPYHVIQLLTHLLNGYLLIVLSKQLFKKTTPGFLAAIIYLTNASHTVSLAWSATYSFQLGITFLLLTIIYYLRKQKILTVIFYFLGLLTSEVLLLTIIILFIIELVYFRKRISRMLIYIFISSIFILARFILFPSKISGVYRYLINSDIFSNLRFYLFRSFGLPMLIKLYIFNNTGKLLIINLLIIVFVGLLFPLFIIKKLEAKNVLFLFLLYFIFLIPFLPLSYHQAPYYLSFSLVGLSLILGYFLSSFLKRKTSFLLLIFLISYLSIQFISFRLTYNTHWLFQRAYLAKKLVMQGIYQADVGSEEYFSLGANSAKKVFEKINTNE